MPSYSVTVATGSQWFAGTDDYIYLSLVGSAQTSERHLLDKAFYNDFERGAIDTYDVSVTEELGDIQLIKIEKRKYWFPDDWYLKYITVKTPNGDYLEFPCYRWITDEKEVMLRDGQAKLFGDDKTHILKNHRRKELEERQKLYRWAEWHPGFPLNIDAKSHKELPRNIQFDSEKGVDFILNYTKAMENLYVNRFMHMFQSSWSDFADFEKIFVRISNTISEYVMHHWQEDFMFGYQFLNGCNPVLIKKCTELPKKFPVTTEMVECSLERNLTLEEEIKQGNIFIVDYELLDGVEVNKTDPCTIQYLAAPICLLYRNLEKKIVPIAIQISQEPKPDNPIFLPSDAKYDWLLAKIWVRSSDFHIHQTVTHLLRTHLVSEVFAVAMFRQLPAVHPLFKLLIPHVRFTIAINTKAREQLICEYGLFDKANATGGGGHVEMVQRAINYLTYSSLCFPEEIKARHMESYEDIPYYYYRDDGLKVWDAIKSFVTDVINIYYKSDEMVCEDVELQAFVKDIYVYGMRGNKSSGFPKTIKTREKLSEYLTVVIFTTSAQHAAVNFGQYDWCSWIPNAPPTMRCPPPTEKGSVTIEYIIESLPDRGRSCWHLGAVWALSQFQENEVFLGMYPDEHFIEKPVKDAMKKFRKNLDDITSDITERNRNKKLPYYYLSPDQIPNSVAV
ncbi:polyunsaturated fatty acid 5-lipoxygenase isoform X1 [Anolis carolinensis]|uniref:Polyunsaturated fatty acid 5-lipoxygenase n=1 Tax=Anolis carolinensis TaxID=28377 RepID=G1KP84_ANOCA|nr:PREDICTED: arachidonate 5-lipoxygenase isoform X1 [Anolis carolinensis]|eukprot:XP_003219928.1 PREDICTED: arachidonate 5-lipoxygenase isoform X1 [Anolis carolinensis]